MKGSMLSIFFVLIPIVAGCAPSSVKNSSENFKRQGSTGEIISTAPPSVPCVSSSVKLCPQFYSEIQRAEREKLKAAYGKFETSVTNFCDYQANELVEFKSFKKELIPAGPGSIAMRGKIPGKPPYRAVVARGKVAEIEIGGDTFVFAREIAVTPKKNPSLSAIQGNYVGFYDSYKNFEHMGWRQYLWFGEFELDENGAARNPWIKKMMRTLYHLHQGGFANIERRLGIPTEQRPKNWFTDVGENYGIPTAVTGSPYQHFSKNGFDHIDLDSNIFDSHPQGQALSKLDIKVTDDALFIITYVPRKIVAKISKDQNIAQYRLCQNTSL